jgi:hypothetical protein
LRITNSPRTGLTGATGPQGIPGVDADVSRIVALENADIATDIRIEALETGGGGPTPLRFVIRDSASNIVGDLARTTLFFPGELYNFPADGLVYFFVGGVAHRAGIDQNEIHTTQVTYPTTDCSGPPYMTEPQVSNSNTITGFELSAEVGRGTNGLLYVGDFSQPAREIVRGSTSNTEQGNCETVPSPSLRWAWPTVQLVVPTFVPPFTMYIE